jgi:hypothetical protein
LAKSTKTSSSLAHRIVRWCTGQCPVPQAGSMVNWLLSGIGRATSLKITGLSGGAPDCPVSHQHPRPTLRRRTRRSQEKNKALRLKFIGLSDGALDCPVSQWRSRPTVGCAICGRRVARTNGQLGTPDSVGAPTSPEDQRSAAPDMEENRAPDMNSSCPVVARAVRCTTRQKARFAFQVDLQWLLPALGL